MLFSDALGAPGLWFPFGIGVSRTQYLLAAATPLLVRSVRMSAPQGAAAS